MDRTYLLPFDIDAPVKELDRFALLAEQEYNLGNSGDWFGSFGGGLSGFTWRVFGVIKHYHELHAWVPRPRSPVEAEYHLTSTFFHMDSALECFVFALNALGNAVAPNGFRDITSDSALRQVAPSDIAGTGKKEPLPGYGSLFPSLQAEWKNEGALLAVIVEQHDVSKHRKAIFRGGQMRMDAPPGFFETLGIQDDPVAQSFLRPWAEIILRQHPKSPRVTRASQEPGVQTLLEDVCADFCAFINTSCTLALSDAKAHIKLPHPHFLDANA